MSIFTASGLRYDPSLESVFATQHIPDKSRIEEGLVFVLPKIDYPERFIQRLQEFGDEFVLALGWGSLYRNVERPNTDSVVDLAGGTFAIRSAVHIQPGQEITVNFQPR